MLNKTIQYLRWTFNKRYLLRILTKIELKQTIAGTKLSYLWWLLEPAINFLCYVFLVAVLHRGGHGKGLYDVPFPLYILTAIFPWYFTKSCISASASTWNKFAGTISQIRFPYLILIFSSLASQLVLFISSFLIIFIVCMLYGYQPHLTWLLLPLVMLINCTMLFGIMMVNALFSFMFTDYKKLLPFLLRIWFYVSPGIWSINMLPARYQKLIMLNPMTILFTDYRKVLLYHQMIDWKNYFIYLVVTVIFSLIALMFFVKREPYINRYI